MSMPTTLTKRQTWLCVPCAWPPLLPAPAPWSGCDSSGSCWSRMPVTGQCGGLRRRRGSSLA